MIEDGYSSRPAHTRGSLFRLWIVVGISLLLASSPMMLLTSNVKAQTGDVGYRDFSFGTNGNSTPTGEKPESKLWWNDGSWWGSLFNSAAGDYHIYRLDLDSQTWVDTGTPLDDRENSKADVLWDGQKLYVVSHIQTVNGQPRLSPSEWGRLYRYSYDTTTRTYTRDAGFPVDVTRGKSETLTIAKDSNGTLWVTYVEGELDQVANNHRVMVNHSNGDDAVWAEPFPLPVDVASATVADDDISSVVAFQGDKIGVMWGNQATSKVYFAVHRDGDPASVWQAEETALPGPNCSGTCVDDHINLKSIQSDSSGRVFAAIKTSLTGSSSPLVMLLVRDLQGNWDSNVFGRVSDHHTRPIVLLDEEQGRVYMFATAKEGTLPKAIYYKSAPIDNIQFPLGPGTLFISSTTDLDINNATSTKQNLNSTTGLVVLASDSTSRYYYHNYLSLASIPATSTPTATGTPTNTPTSTPIPTGIKDITFENGSLIHRVTGADSVVNAVTLETQAPLVGTYAARIPNAANS